MPLQVAPGRLWLRTIDVKPRIEIRCYLGETAPKVVDGYGGWTVVARNRRRGMVEWTGNNPIAIEIPFMMDDWEAQKSVEKDMNDLEKMAGIGPPEGPEPPLVHWDANSQHDAREASHLDWVIEGLEWDTNISRNEDGETVRASGTLTLRQFVGDELLSTFAKARKKSKNSTHKVKKGESLMTIAKKELGNANRWPEIVRLNPGVVRDPRNPKDGLVLRMP